MSKSKVYFVKLNELDKIKDLIPELSGPLGVKVHFGEEGNNTYLPAKYVKEISSWLDNPTLIETSVLYKSVRSEVGSHRKLALRHGFNFADIDFLDGATGDDSMAIKIDKKHFKECWLGSGLAKYRSLLVASHFKGHISAGFGGALKNLGMGLASRRGKLSQHAFVKHSVDPEKCISCGICINNCPVNAISFDENQKAKINQEKCISCSKCIGICPVNAVTVPLGKRDIGVFRERVVEYALAGAKNKKCFYINFLVNITEKCDCAGEVMKPMTDDIGILVSDDPVAIDQASYDLVVRQCEKFKEQNGDEQLAHGEEIGLGQRAYELVKI